MAQRLLRAVLAAAAVLAAVLVAAWLAFVPVAKEPPYQFVAAWGGTGDGPGQFDDPTGIAVAGEELFVADARNGRIQVFGVLSLMA